MSGVYPFPEWEDVVHGYLVSLYKVFGKPVPLGIIVTSMRVDSTGEKVLLSDVQAALDLLEAKELIQKVGKSGYKPLEYSEALRQQLGLDEVDPFTREYGETQEAHTDKIWSLEEKLVKPEAGGRYGLYPTSHFFVEDRRWRGLVQL